jgi:hypothetical protein
MSTEAKNFSFIYQFNHPPPPDSQRTFKRNSNYTKEALTKNLDASLRVRHIAYREQDLDFEDDKRGFFRILDSLYGRIFRCPRGKHKRSSSHIRKTGDQYTSRCRSCRKPMVRLSKRNWALDDRRA